MTEHKHPMTKHEIKLCTLRFGQCWVNPPKTDKTRSQINNKPSGASARDSGNLSAGKE